MYAQKLIDEAQGDENKLYDLFIQKTCRTSYTPRYRRILRSVKNAERKNITYTEKMAQKILRSSSIKRMRMKFIRSQEPISATKRKS